MEGSTKLGGRAALALTVLFSPGCGSDGGGAGSASSTATSTAEAQKSAPPAAVATSAVTATVAPSPPLASNAVVIDSLKLAIEPPPGTTGGSHEMGNGVSILSFSGHPVSITVSLAHGDLAYAKKHRETDEGFQKWVTETEDTAVAEMLVDKKKEYYGFVVRKIGDKTYECGTLTMKRRSSPNEKAVREALALCNGLRLK